MFMLESKKPNPHLVNIASPQWWASELNEKENNKKRVLCRIGLLVGLANTRKLDNSIREVWNLNSNGNWNDWNWNYYDQLNYRNYVLPFLRSFYFRSLCLQNRKS